jgi:LysR family glycine cleavage system transcriptional activator
MAPTCELDKNPNSSSLNSAKKNKDSAKSETDNVGRKRDSIKRLPPLITLRYFAVAARTGSFATAARRLHVTPAAISHQIKYLEDDLGVELFVRHHRKVSPTPAAEAVLPILEEAFSAITEAVEQLRAQSENRWVVTVCAEPLFATKWLVPRMHRFYAKYPEAEIRLQASLHSIDNSKLSSINSSSFRRTGIDLAVRFGYGTYQDLESVQLLQVSMVPICSPKLSFELPFSTPEKLINYPLISDSASARSPERFGWQEWLIDAEVELQDNYKERLFGNGLLALEATINGQGIILTSRNLVQQEIENKKLTIAYEEELPCTFAYYVVCPSNSLERPIIRAFREWLIDEAKSETAKAPDIE